MKNIFLRTALSLLFLPFHSFAQNPSFNWMKNLDTSTVTIRDAAADAQGNFIIAGEFMNTVDFDPGPALVTYSCTGMFNGDAFFAKYSTTGSLVWVKVLPSSTREVFEKIELSANGDIVLLGTYYGATDLDPGPGTASVALNGNSGCDFMLARYDSTGNYLWGKSWGGTATEFVADLNIDKQGNIIVAGQFTGSCDLDPGPAVQMAYVQSNPMDYDIFCSSFSGNGNLNWAWSIGTTNTEQVKTIATDSTGNIYLSGYFNGSMDMDPGSGQQLLISTNGFTAKYNSSGGYLWAKNFDVYPSHSLIGQSQNIFLFFNATIAFDADPGSGVSMTSHIGTYDIAVASLDPSGNYVNSVSIAGPNHQFVSSCSKASDGTFLLTGFYEGAADFDPGAGTVMAPAPSFRDAYVIGLDEQLDLHNFHFLNSSVEMSSDLIAAGPNGSYFIVPRFRGQVDFDPSANNFLQNNPGLNYATGFAKYQSGPSSITESSVSNQVNIFPNPAGSFLVLQSEGGFTDAVAEFYDAAGRKVKSETGITGNSQTFSVDDLASGYYIIRLINQQEMIQLPLIISH